MILTPTFANTGQTVRVQINDVLFLQTVDVDFTTNLKVGQTVPSTDIILGLNALNGSVYRQRKLNSPSPWIVFVMNGEIFATADFGMIYTYSASNGREIWHQKYKDSRGPPVPIIAP